MRKITLGLFALSALFAVVGCETVSEEPTTPAPVFITFPRLAPTAPPIPIDEVQQFPTIPAKEIWRPGYWDYDGTHYSWVSGELMPRPSPTAVWAPDMWVQHSYGWGFRPGYWQ